MLLEPCDQERQMFEFQHKLNGNKLGQPNSPADYKQIRIYVLAIYLQSDHCLFCNNNKITIGSIHRLDNYVHL